MRGGGRSGYICSPSRQEAAQEKKPKRREKLKRRGQAGGEQAQPEESGLAELEPPLPKKTKQGKESGGAERAAKAPAAQSSGAASPGEQDGRAEVGALRGLPR